MSEDKKVRGKGKKVALSSTSIRLDSVVVAYFKEKFGRGAQAKMREVLSEYVKANS
jgi:uncharacterized protein (DUF4415 family)